MIPIVAKNRRRRAFTLAELAVVIALFGLFSTTALASLSLTLRHWKTMSAQTDVYTACRTAVNPLSKEMRQGIPNRAPYFIVYYRESPSEVTTEATSVVNPCTLNTSSSDVTFYEANPAFFSPAVANFREVDPRCYRTVRYYVRNGSELRRNLKTYDSTGNKISEDDALIVACDRVSLLVTCKSASVYKVDFSASKTYGSSTKEASLSTTVHVLGR